MAVFVDTIELVSVIAASAAILASIFAALGWLLWDVSRRGKARILWYDPDGATTPISWHKLTSGNQITLGKGDEARTFLLDAKARLPGYPATWIVHSRHGWNYTDPASIPAELRQLPTYKALADQETVHRSEVLRILTISNPAQYHREIATNRPRNAINANDDTDRWGWVPFVATAVVICMVAILGMVIYLVNKVGSGAA